MATAGHSPDTRIASLYALALLMTCPLGMSFCGMGRPMSDHYAEAERLITSGNINAAIAHAILALVDEFRDDDLPLSVWPQS